MIQFRETTGASLGKDEHTRKWLVTGILDIGVTEIYMNGLAPPIIAGSNGSLLYRQPIQVTEEAWMKHVVSVPYGPEPSSSNTNPGSVSFNFSATGGSFHITHAREPGRRYPSNAVDYKQAINVVKDGGELTVEGVEIVQAQLKMSYTIRHPNGVVNEAFARNIAAITGCVNSTPFRGFAAGEVLFLGGDGSDGTNAEAEVTLHFAAEKNLQNLVIGAIENIRKDGHELLWVMWKDNVASGKPTKEPLAVYVEKVYRNIDLSAALGM